ncbi:MAG: LruC domain-containing protein, partial [Bacteroidota bacterium]
MRTKIFLSAFLVMQMTVSAVFATTRYVSLTGSNTAPFISLATAATDIQSAVNVSLDGDLILIDDGTYLLSTYIYINKGVTVKSIHGANMVIADGNHVTKCFVLNHTNAVVDGLTIRNAYHPGGFGGGVNIQTGGTVKNCTLHDNQARDGGGVAIDDAGLVQNCYIYNNLASDGGSDGYGGGVRMLNGGTTRNCLVTGNSSLNLGGGINIWNAGIVENCVITKNTAPNGAGIRTQNVGKVYNSIIYFNNGSNYQVGGSGYFYYNCCTTPALPVGYSSGCIASDPMFINTTPGSEDYHLQAGSPCIDAGMNLGWMATVTDLDGNERIQNGIADMGCYEKAPAPVDSDGDGVPDIDDDYPSDPFRAFDNYYPASGFGTLAFEDLWPGKGDYDFNDLVCDYRFKTVTNASNKVVEIFSTFVIKAFGATLHNGFGFQLNDAINPAHLAVTGYSLTSGYITLSGNGTEAGQTRPTVIVFD